MDPPTAIARIPISENETIRRKERVLFMLITVFNSTLFYYIVHFTLLLLLLPVLTYFYS